MMKFNVQPKNKFDLLAKQIKEKHFSQTIDDVIFLNNKYKNPIFGKLKLWDLFQKLNFCIDPTDKILYQTNQLIHTAQVLKSMEIQQITDEMLYVTAILHDIGKVLLLTEENPCNIVCDNQIIVAHTNKLGFENCFTNWNHDEIAYQRLKDYIPKEYSWLIRYHSINIEKSKSFMNEYDIKMYQEFLLPFSKHDKMSKSQITPSINWDKYRKMCEKHLPIEIIF
jgi:hypothetical protein